MIKYRTALVGGVFVLYLRTEYHTPVSDWPLVIAKRTDRSTQCCFYFMFYKNVALECEADHTPPFSAKVKKEWIYTSIHPFAFISCTVRLPLKYMHLIKRRSAYSQILQNFSAVTYVELMSPPTQKSECWNLKWGT